MVSNKAGATGRVLGHLGRGTRPPMGSSRRSPAHPLRQDQGGCQYASCGDSACRGAGRDWPWGWQQSTRPPIVGECGLKGREPSQEIAPRPEPENGAVEGLRAGGPCSLPPRKEEAFGVELQKAIQAQQNARLRVCEWWRRGRCPLRPATTKNRILGWI